LCQKRWYVRFSRPASGAKTAKCCGEKIWVRANLSSYDANALYKLIYSLLAKNYGISLSPLMCWMSYMKDSLYIRITKG
jgi:hypothetical protein